VLVVQEPCITCSMAVQPGIYSRQCDTDHRSVQASLHEINHPVVFHFAILMLMKCVLCHRKPWAVAIQTSCLLPVHLLGATALPPVAAAPQPLPLPQAALLAAPPPQLLPLHLLIRPVMCQLLSSRCLPPPLRPPLRPRQLPQS